MIVGLNQTHVLLQRILLSVCARTYVRTMGRDPSNECVIDHKDRRMIRLNNVEAIFLPSFLLDCCVCLRVER